MIQPLAASAAIQKQSTNTAHEAVEKLASFIQQTARNLAPSDPSTQDDVAQEMFLAVLEQGDGHKLAYYRARAIGRAKNYLGRERQARRHRAKEVSAGDLKDLERMERQELEREQCRKTSAAAQCYEEDWAAIDAKLDARPGLVRMEI